MRNGEELMRDAVGTVLAGPQLIEMQEREGQRELVESTVLPVQMAPSREAFEKLGFKFGAVVDGDPLFVNAELPRGWTRRETDHALWSNVLDDKGRKRVAVFYKAASYDRRSEMRLEPRYDYKIDRDANGEFVYAQWIDSATGEIIGPRWTKDEWFDGKSKGWLGQNRPDHIDPVKAWEEPHSCIAAMADGIVAAIDHER